MFSRKPRENSAIGTLIGAGTVVTGDLGFTGGLHLDGRIVGDVSGAEGTLTIGASGVIEGSVRVDHLMLNGAVSGDVVARERVELGPTAKVDGNVVYNVLQMAEGARINGRLIHQTEGQGALPAPPADDIPKALAPPGDDGTSGLR
jgi:cytoskeletal protein CcmA (bactofilin family)